MTKMPKIMENDDWIQPGAEVVEMSYLGFRSVPDPQRSTIERVGKRDVVLANGKRYSRKVREGFGPYKGALKETGRGHHGGSRHLIPVDHPEVFPAEQRRIAYGKRAKLREAMENWIKDSSNDEKLERVRDLIDQYL